MRAQNTFSNMCRQFQCHNDDHMRRMVELSETFEVSLVYAQNFIVLSLTDLQKKEHRNALGDIWFSQPLQLYRNGRLEGGGRRFFLFLAGGVSPRTFQRDHFIDWSENYWTWSKSFSTFGLLHTDRKINPRIYVANTNIYLLINFVVHVKDVERLSDHVRWLSGHFVQFVTDVFEFGGGGLNLLILTRTYRGR